MPEVSEQDGGPSKAALVIRFWRERQAFIGFARKYVYDPDVGEEIFQEACLRFLRSNAKFRGFLPAAAYLYKIMKSVIIDRHKKNRWLVFPETLPEMVCEPEPEWHNRMLIEKLLAATRRLSPYDRQILSIEFFSDLPDLREKSYCMDLPVSTFRYQSQKAVHRLRKLMNSKPNSAVNCQEDRIGGKSNAIASS